jgi:formate-dependent nitrite reductase membrane component NrfD
MKQKDWKFWVIILLPGLSITLLLLFFVAKWISCAAIGVVASCKLYIWLNEKEDD